MKIIFLAQQTITAPSSIVLQQILYQAFFRNRCKECQTLLFLKGAKEGVRSSQYYNDFIQGRARIKSRGSPLNELYTHLQFLQSLVPPQSEHCIILESMTPWLALPSTARKIVRTITVAV